MSATQPNRDDHQVTPQVAIQGDDARAQGSVPDETIYQQVSPLEPEKSESLITSSLDNSAPRGGKRQLQFGKQPKLNEEFRTALRIRLRSAALVLLIGFSLFSIRDIVATNLRMLMIPQSAITLMFAWIVFALSRCERATELKLRIIELLIFFSPAGLTIALSIDGLLEASAAQDPVTAVQTTKMCLVSFFGLIMIYGTFIPSSWKRALVVCGALALAMPITMIVTRLSLGADNFAIRSGTTFVDVTNNTIVLFLGATAAVVAAHTTSRLRREAFKAKQMGQYRLKKMIGRGGMGEVYLGEHSLLRRPCAIKVLRSDRDIDERTLSRFEQEVRLTSCLTHPNTVQVYDYGRDETGRFFYVMEYLPGLSLQDLVDRHGPLPVERACYLIAQVVDALTEAEAKQLVHRDIKPSNILITQRGGKYDVAKLVDFGLARPIHQPEEIQHTVAGSVTGSPLYLSPEQALGTEPDTRSDLYSLAAVLFFAVTGRPPFDEQNPMLVVIAHARDEAPPLKSVMETIPEPVAELVDTCLKKKPAERIATAEEFLSKLQTCSQPATWSQVQAKDWWRQIDLQASDEGEEQASAEGNDALPYGTSRHIDETIEYTR